MSRTKELRASELELRASELELRASELELTRRDSEPSQGSTATAEDLNGHAHELPPRGSRSPRTLRDGRCHHSLLVEAPLTTQTSVGGGLLASSEEVVILERMRRAPDWAVVVNNIAFMAVPRSVPANFAQTGWYLGICTLVYSSYVTYDTGMLIGRLSTQCGARSFPELSAEAMGRFASRRGWREHRRRTARQLAHWLTLAMQFATYYLTEVCELIYFEQYFGQIFEKSALCQWQWMLVCAALALPVLQVPTFHEGRWVALVLGLLPLSLNVLVFFYEVLLVRPWTCAPGPTWSFAPPSARRAFVGLTAFAYAYGGHGLYPEEVREMAVPSRWPRVMRLTYAAVLPLYWGCGLLGYYAYGDFANANININFPPNGPNFASIGVQMVQELYFLYSTNLVLMLAIELALGLDPSVACAPSWHGLPPWAGRLLLRGGLFASQTFVAQLLLAGEGDTLIALQSLIGAVGMTAFTYFLPYALYLMMSAEEATPARRVWCVGNIGIGMVVTIAGVYFSIDELVGSSAGLFAGDCKLEYAYSPASPDDPCYSERGLVSLTV